MSQSPDSLAIIAATIAPAATAAVSTRRIVPPIPTPAQPAPSHHPTPPRPLRNRRRHPPFNLHPTSLLHLLRPHHHFCGVASHNPPHPAASLPINRLHLPPHLQPQNIPGMMRLPFGQLDLANLY